MEQNSKFYIFENMKDFIKNPIVKKLLFVLIGIFILLMVFNYLIMPWYTYAAEIKVPNVVGMPAEEAVKLLENNKLTSAVGDTVLDNRYPKNSVVSQRPGSSSAVKSGRRIFLIVSGGDQTSKVPNLMGKSLIDAKLALEKAGLRIGDVRYVPSTTPKDIIVSQEFVSGMSIRRTSRVRISISLGAVEGTIEVPNLVGKSKSEAEEILKGLQLEVGKISFLPTLKELLPNTVADQYPAGGAKVNHGDKIDLFICKYTEIKEDEFNAKHL